MARDPIILLLPEPPSANRLWRNNRVSPAYRSWKKTAGWEAKIQLVGVETLMGNLAVRMEIPDQAHGKTSRDLDNNIKPVLDLCQAVGAIENDKFVVEIHVYRNSDRENVLVELAQA